MAKTEQRREMLWIAGSRRAVSSFAVGDIDLAISFFDEVLSLPTRSMLGRSELTTLFDNAKIFVYRRNG